MTELDSLVSKQLSKLGLHPERPPDPDGWRRFLARVSNHYRHVDDDRRLLARSLELSSEEMHQLQQQVIDERDRLRRLVSAISDGLSGFRQVIEQLPRTSDASEVTRTISYAKGQLSSRLAELFAGTGGAAWSGEEAQAARSEFVHLSEQLLELLKATAQKAVLQKELEVARTVQHLLVPSADVIERGWVKLAGFFQPAAQCGGDWWTAHDLADGKVLAVIGDVTGHGVAPAIITGAAKAACDIVRMMAGHDLTVSSLLQMMNQGICEAARQQLFMTCSASVFDPERRTVTIANAGHTFPFLVRRADDEVKLSQLVAMGNPLGASVDSRYDSKRIELADGDVLLWYTDGITDCENVDAQPFGDKRLRRTLLRLAGAEPRRIRDGIAETVASFCGAAVPTDDMTMVVACVNG